MPRSGEEHAAPIRVFGNRHDVRERMPRRQAGADLFPCLTEVGRFVDERIAVVHQMQIDDDIRRGGIEV